MNQNHFYFQADAVDIEGNNTKAGTMCSRCLSDLRSFNGGDDDDNCPQCPSHSSCGEFKDHRCLAHIMRICRTHDQAAVGGLFSQVEAQRRNRRREKWLSMTCVLFFILAFTFLMGTVGKEDNDAQDYDADVFLPSKAVWLLGCLLFWTVWLLLLLLQMFLLLIKLLLWLISIFASPLFSCASFLLTCVILLLHYTCNALFFATTSPVYVYGMFLCVIISLLIFTR